MGAIMQANGIRVSDLVSWRLNSSYPKHFGVVSGFQTRDAGTHFEQVMVRVVDSNGVYRLIPIRFVSREVG